MLVSKRLQAIIDHYNLSALSFSKELGFDRADKIYNILKDKFNPSYEILLAITNKFVDINIEWLLTGEGNMLKEPYHASQPKIDANKSKYQVNTDNSRLVCEPQKKGYATHSIDQTSDTDNEKILRIPVMDVWAAAGPGFFNVDYPEVLGEMNFPVSMLQKPCGKYFCGRINGESMLPTLFHKDYIIFRQLNLSECQSLKSNEIYFIVEKSGASYVKRLENYLTEGYILCKSDNADKVNFYDFKTEANDIAHVYHVEWRFSQNMININETYYSELNEMKEDMKEIKQYFKQLNPKK